MASIRKNLISNVITLCVNVLIGIIFTPFLIHKLGMLAYGVIPLTLIINQYIGVLTTALTNSFSRFYTIAYQAGDYNKAKDYLSASFSVILFIIIILTPFLIYFVLYINRILVIPDQFIYSAQLLFTFTILCFYASLVTSLLNVILYAINRIDLINITKNIRNILRLCFVYFLFAFFDNSITYVGVGNILSELFVLITSIIFFNKYKPNTIKIKLFFYDKYIMFSILSMTFWIIIQKIGDILIYRSDNLITNLYFGLNNSAKLGAIGEFGSYIISIASVIGGLFGPLILAEYAKNNHEQVRNYILNQSYIVGSISAVIVGVLIGLSKDFLNIWIGEELSVCYVWFIIKLIPIPFMASGVVLAYTYVAWNRIVKPALWTVFIGVLAIAASITISICLKSIEIMIIVNSLFIIIQSYVLNLYLSGEIYKELNWPLIKNSLKISVIIIISAIQCYFASNIFNINNLYILIIMFVVLCIIAFGITYSLLYNKDAKECVVNLLKDKKSFIHK